MISNARRPRGTKSTFFCLSGKIEEGKLMVIKFPFERLTSSDAYILQHLIAQFM